MSCQAFSFETLTPEQQEAFARALAELLCAVAIKKYAEKYESSTPSSAARDASLPVRAT
jgi:hypothetical protein